MRKQIIKTYDKLGQTYFNLRKDKKSGPYFYNELTETPTTLKLLGMLKEKRFWI